MTTPSRTLLAAALGALLFLTAHAAPEAKKNFNLPAGEAASTLKQFSEASGRETLFAAEAVRGVKTQAVKGELTPKEALDAMLGGTGLTAVQDAKTGALAVKRIADPNAPRVAQETATTLKNPGTVEDGVLKLATFEVMGTRLLNMDLPRSRDDAQPYVIFNRTIITQSGATSIEDFLRQRLSMETTAMSESQTSSLIGARSTINLRGLGANQTLILIDGHRTGGGTVAGLPFQADLNGIPLGAVERIEVLPTTASGIYGGSATGGVVNVVLRRDYAGVEFKATYDNSFNTDSAKRRVDLTAGLTLEGGKTNILLAASYTDANTLLVGDRDFLQRGRTVISTNNPNYYLTATGITPPLGATPNIRSANGQDLKLKDGTPLNALFTHIPAGYAGPAVDGTAALVANAGKYNLDGANAANGLSGGLKRALLNGPTIETAAATIRRQFSPKLQAFLDFSASNNTGHFIASAQGGYYQLPVTAPNNPFAQPVYVMVPLVGGESEYFTSSQNRRAVAGVITKLPGEWQAGLDLTYERNRFTNSFPASTTGAETAAITSGQLDIMRDTNRYPIDFSPYVAITPAQTPIITQEKIGTLRASGPVWSLPAGRPSFSFLIERREEIFGASAYFNAVSPERSQLVESAYGELKVPLMSQSWHVPGIEVLDLQLAGRTDSYTTHGSNTSSNPTAIILATNKVRSSDPTVGIRYVPVQDVMLRASYGTGFLPPNVSQLVRLNTTPISNPGGFTTDPRRGNTLIGPFTYSLGGNPDLRPELSESWSAGAVLTPRVIPHLRISVDWTKISKRDNIATLGFADVIVNEAFLPGRVTRGPNLATDPAGWAGPITALDLTNVNIARTRVEAYDFALDYHLDTPSLGAFDFFTTATRSMHYLTQVVPSAPVVENTGVVTGAGQTSSTPNFPLKWKGNAGFTWKYHRWTAGWTLRYYDSYVINVTTPGAVLAQGSKGVPGQTYHDVFASYRVGPFATGTGSRLRTVRDGFLRNTELQVGIRNIFNHEPPFDVSNAANLYSGFGDPRLATYYITIKKAL